MSFLTLISRQKVKVAYIYFHSIISTNIGGCSSIALYSEFCLSINRILLDFPHRKHYWKHYSLWKQKWRNYFKEKCLQRDISLTRIFSRDFFQENNNFSLLSLSLSFLYFPAFNFPSITGNSHLRNRISFHFWFIFFIIFATYSFRSIWIINLYNLSLIKAYCEAAYVNANIMVDEFSQKKTFYPLHRFNQRFLQRPSRIFLHSLI